MILAQKLSRALPLLLVLPLLLALFSPLPAFAKHKSKKATKSPSTTATLAKNKLFVVANFSNLANVKSVSYELTYDSAKGPQGAGGTIAAKGKNASRKLLLGTCSGKVCTYHKNVQNIKLSVDFNLKSGGVISYEKSVR